jgi:hypothetical protein
MYKYKIKSPPESYHRNSFSITSALQQSLQPTSQLPPLNMHASTIFTALFAAVAVAAPASTATNDVAARAADTAELAASAQTMLDAKAAAGCNILSAFTPT